MDDQARKEIEKLIEEAFYRKDLAAHRQYHEDAEDKARWYKKLFRNLVEKAALAAFTVIGGWGAYALWVAFKQVVTQ